MSFPVRFSRYRPEYQEQILDLHRSAVEGFVLGMSQQEDEADLMAIEQVYLGSGGKFLVGFLEATLVAMGGFEHLSATTAELRRMRIAKPVQGKGYGTQLLRELEFLACACGVRTLTLETAKARALTLAFYRNRGYEECGHGHYGAVETVRFAKPLHPKAVGQSPCNSRTLEDGSI